MRDLQAELLALIQAVRHETPHAHDCWLTERGIGSSVTVRLGGIPEGCDCDWVARFEAELARRLAEKFTAPPFCTHGEPTRCLSCAAERKADLEKIGDVIAAARRNAPHE